MFDFKSERLIIVSSFMFRFLFLHTIPQILKYLSINAEDDWIVETAFANFDKQGNWLCYLIQNCLVKHLVFLKSLFIIISVKFKISSFSCLFKIQVLVVFWIVVVFTKNFLKNILTFIWKSYSRCTTFVFIVRLCRSVRTFFE